MEKKKIFVLDEKDNKIANLLTELGLPKPVSQSIVYFVQSNKECNSLEIESIAQLRQPEVSIAMRYLRDKKWVTKRDEKKKGKGRPVHFYKLVTSMKKIVEELEEEKKKEIEKIKKDLEEIKKFISS